MNYLKNVTLKSMMLAMLVSFGFTSCSDEYCEEKSTYCYNGTSVVKKTTIYTSSGPIDSGLEEWEVVVPQNVGDKSVCFIYHSPCNP